MSTVTKPYPKEFRDVVRVAMNREPGVELAQIAKNFGIHFTTLYDWIKKADVGAGTSPGRRLSRLLNWSPRSGGSRPLSKKWKCSDGRRPTSTRADRLRGGWDGRCGEYVFG